ncbi:MAG: hypothetical protein GY700_06445 [Propionibacteriaceae bacterium]|nr:hypothetical protein [Propionibacteriaceae bacterium]
MGEHYCPECGNVHATHADNDTLCATCETCHRYEKQVAELESDNRRLREALDHEHSKCRRCERLERMALQRDGHRAQLDAFIKVLSDKAATELPAPVIIKKIADAANAALTPEPEGEAGERKFRLEVKRADPKVPGFGFYEPGKLPVGEAFLGIDNILFHCATSDATPRQVIADVLCHELVHVVEEIVGLTFDEDEIDRQLEFVRSNPGPGAPREIAINVQCRDCGDTEGPFHHVQCEGCVEIVCCDCAGAEPESVEVEPGPLADGIRDAALLASGAEPESGGAAQKERAEFPRPGQDGHPTLVIGESMGTDGGGVNNEIEVIGFLWGLLDDIDTYSDMAKADDKLYRSLVERCQARRWECGITTDGSDLDLSAMGAPESGTAESAPRNQRWTGIGGYWK